MVNIPKDFKEFLQLLNDKKVEYLIVGGYAVGYHGHPRSTGDIDIFVSTTVENARLLVQCLAEFGFEQLGISMDDLTKSDHVIQLGYPPLRIDILTAIDGVTFSDAWRSRITETIDGLTLHIISLRHLIENKRASNRLQDAADIAELDQG